MYIHTYIQIYICIYTYTYRLQCSPLVYIISNEALLRVNAHSSTQKKSFYTLKRGSILVSKYMHFHKFTRKIISVESVLF